MAEDEELHVEMPTIMQPQPHSMQHNDEEEMKPMRVAHTYDDDNDAVPLAKRRKVGIFLIVMLLASLALTFEYQSYNSNSNQAYSHNSLSQEESSSQDLDAFPKELLGKDGSYDKSKDFINGKGIVPAFWGTSNNHTAATSCSGKLCQQQTKTPSSTTWGPCYPPSSHVNWKDEIKKYQKKHIPSYHKRPQSNINREPNPDLSGYCRPGFIIIGAGKCATSSLYHYITGHPRVLPANKKQIHYFRYYAYFNMEWYLGHFPTTTSFLSSGALMTGEASPGYLPYPKVAKMVANRLPGPKIIMIGRDPLDRAWSSYKYNYVTPAMIRLRGGKHPSAPKGKSDEFYETFLFSFEEMVGAELKQLRECLQPGGIGEKKAREDWYDQEWARVEYDRRESEGLPALVDMDKYCYGDKVSKEVPRAQWKELVEKHPHKIIDIQNLHLVQSFIGRSLYTLPLEWWYATFPSEDIYFVCTEELRDETGEPINELGQFLGLPSYNFSDVIAEGMYNVGFNQGYDKATSWDKVEQEEEEEAKESGNEDAEKPDIPLSDELLEEVLQFIRPFNERLFSLTGRKCNW